ncbi:hypothetical protein [Nocardia yamanashiensis]|uniref:hypothetical protein n=1 Tax=Nocardia yamanashiensis TaxID=209247 RepID=UPI00082A3843|nr:hypothetical protein [Nocardia yamanashiensis]
MLHDFWTALWPLLLVAIPLFALALADPDGPLRALWWLAKLALAGLVVAVLLTWTWPQLTGPHPFLGFIVAVFATSAALGTCWAALFDRD